MSLRIARSWRLVLVVTEVYLPTLKSFEFLELWYANAKYDSVKQLRMGISECRTFLP